MQEYKKTEKNIKYVCRNTKILKKHETFLQQYKNTVNNISMQEYKCTEKTLNICARIQKY